MFQVLGPVGLLLVFNFEARKIPKKKPSCARLRASWERVDFHPKVSTVPKENDHFFVPKQNFKTQPPKNPLMSGRQERKRISSHTILSDAPNRWQLEIGRFRGGSSTCWRGWIDLLGGIDVGCGSIGEESFGYFKWFEWGCESWRLFRAFVGCLTWWGVRSMMKLLNVPRYLRNCGAGDWFVDQIMPGKLEWPQPTSPQMRL